MGWWESCWLFFLGGGGANEYSGGEVSVGDWGYKETMELLRERECKELGADFANICKRDESKCYQEEEVKL